jgi:hypothetical protein
VTATLAPPPARTAPFLPSLGIALASAAAFGSSGPFAPGRP